MVSGAPVLRGMEHGVGRAAFDDAARFALLGEEEGTPVGDSGRLLHVVGHDDDRDLLRQALDGFLHASRGRRVERRARFVHQQQLSRMPTQPTRKMRSSPRFSHVTFETGVISQTVRRLTARTQFRPHTDHRTSTRHTPPFAHSL